MKLVNLGHAQRWVLQIAAKIYFFTLLYSIVESHNQDVSKK